MATRISEYLGLVCGYLLGVILAAGSIFRNARIFHPRGLLFCGDLELLPDSVVKLPPHVLIRFSAGWWKTMEWPDALGLALRMSEKKITGVVPGPGDRDLLFATFRKPWELPLSPLLTDQHDFLNNSYFAISPFEHTAAGKVEFMIDPSRGHRSGGSREDKLLGNVLGGGVMLRLMMREAGTDAWKLIARVFVRKEVAFDQEALRFHPFMTGTDLRPSGFIQHMRRGAYRLSQWVRPGAESGEESVVLGE